MDTDNFTVYVKADDICKDTAENGETGFSTSNFETDRLLPKEKNKKVIGLMRNELGGTMMKKFKI